MSHKGERMTTTEGTHDISDFGAIFRSIRDADLPPCESFLKRGGSERGPVTINLEGNPDFWTVDDVKEVLLLGARTPSGTKIRIRFNQHWNPKGFTGSSWLKLVDQLDKEGFLPRQHNFICLQGGGDIYVSLYSVDELT